MEEYPQPIQALHNMKEKLVVVETRTGERIDGKLMAFDLYTNITLSTVNGTRFIQGGTVNYVFLKESEKVAETTEKVDEEPKTEEEQTETEEKPQEDAEKDQSPEDTPA